MDYTINQQNNVWVVSINGSLLALVEDHERELLDDVTDKIKEGYNKFVIDLQNIKFVNSSGLGILLTCLTKARRAGGDVVLANIPDPVNNLLKITKLDIVFTSAPDRNAAVEKLA